MNDLFGLSNIYIDDQLRPECSKYLGIYSSDNIPQHLSIKLGTLIANLSPEGTLGSHFITIILLPSKILYIDSLGQKCKNVNICNFMNSCEKPVYYQSECMQDSESSYCGFYAMLVVTTYELTSRWKNPFKKNCKTNDFRCIRLLSDNMKKLKEE